MEAPSLPAISAYDAQLVESLRAKRRFRPTQRALQERAAIPRFPFHCAISELPVHSRTSRSQ